MSGESFALKLLVEALGLQFSISDVDRRKQVQKAVYLGQRAGVDLGYRYGWYLMGPYSPALTKDYYQLASRLRKPNDSDRYTLRKDLQDRLQLVRECIETAPQGVERGDWLEIVASVDFLLRVSGLTESGARAVLKREKPHLEPYYEQAVAALEAAGLQG